MLNNIKAITAALPDAQLRSHINNYLLRVLSKKSTVREEREAAARVAEMYPEILDWYIKRQEDRGHAAEQVSQQHVKEVEQLLITQVKQLVEQLQQRTRFYEITGDTYNDAYQRVMFLKDIIENKGGHRLFYLKGKPIRTEEHLHILYRLTWNGTLSDVSREVNDGRGPVDFKVSRGAADKALVEFKLASNSQLKRNLQNQVPIYEKASDARRSLKVIVYFSIEERNRVKSILKDLKLQDDPTIILIDACMVNKLSASKA
jgi:hypothetical protein